MDVCIDSLKYAAARNDERAVRRILGLPSLTSLEQKKQNRLVTTQTFEQVCCNGQVNTAQCLLNEQPELHISGNLFYDVCIRGHLEMARWLHSLRPTVPISHQIFANTCKNGHINVAKWLILYILSKELTEQCVKEGIQHACANGHTDIVIWLLGVGAFLTINDMNMLIEQAYQSQHRAVADVIRCTYKDRFGTDAQCIDYVTWTNKTNTHSTHIKNN